MLKLPSQTTWSILWLIPWLILWLPQMSLQLINGLIPWSLINSCLTFSKKIHCHILPQWIRWSILQFNCFEHSIFVSLFLLSPQTLPLSWTGTWAWFRLGPPYCFLGFLVAISPLFTLACSPFLTLSWTRLKLLSFYPSNSVMVRPWPKER